ncbi:MAG: hypothetical protein IJU00_00300, partial [Selenomonas sp.]|nr:hypothetical protein [Selenomonas sp.]
HNGAERARVYGEAGKDFIKNNGARALLDGGAGNDRIENWDDGINTTIKAGAGNDSIYSYTGKVIVYSGSGNDTIRILGAEDECPVIHAEGDRNVISLGKVQNAIVLGSAGGEEIRFDESFWYANGATGANVTLNGGKGNDTLYGSRGQDLFRYASGDGADIIENYDFQDVIQLTSGKVDSYSLSGGDLILKVGKGSITLKNMANHAINFMDKNGNISTKYYGTGYTAKEVIQNFVQTISESPLQGMAALDEAVKAGTSFKDANDVVNRLVADCQAAGNADTFLKKYCGINLDNEDTGIITGWDAGGMKAVSREELVPETGKAVYPGKITFTKRGVTVTVPKKSSLTKQQQLVVQGIYSWWLDGAIDLIEKSYGMSFEKNPLSISITFDKSNSMNVSCGNNYGTSMSYADFKASDKSGGGLDAAFAAFLAYPAQNAFGIIGNFSNAMASGLAALMTGDENYIWGRIRELAGNPSKLAQYINGSISSNGDGRNEAAGYILWRYLAKQASDSYDASVAHPWDDKVKINGTSGNDLLAARGDKVTLSGGKGLDTLTAYGVSNSLSGGAGNDYLFAGTGATKTVLDGGSGKDTLRAAGDKVTVYGGANNDIIYLEGTGDVVRYVSGDGNDVVYGYKATKDTIRLDSVQSYSVSTSGKDTLLKVGTGSLTLKNAKNETLNLVIYGTDNANRLSATAAGSKLYGLGGNDTLTGGKGRDYLEGGKGHDCLYGGSGNDTIKGGTGNDTLCGGKGNDTLYGGTGKDIYLYSNGDGNDKIMDYSSSQAVKVMSGKVGSMYASQKHSLAGAGYVQDVVLTVGDGSIMLKNLGCSSTFNVIDAGGGKKSYKVSSLVKRNI